MCFPSLCFYSRSTGSRTRRCFLLQRRHLSQNPMHTCKQSGFDEEGLWGLCTVNNLYGFIGSLFVHDWAASALEGHQHIANRSSAYFLPCGIHLGVASIAPKLNSLHKCRACRIAQLPSIVLLCCIYKHRMASRFQTSSIWKVAGIWGLLEFSQGLDRGALQMYTVWSVIPSPHFTIKLCYSWDNWTSCVIFIAVCFPCTVNDLCIYRYLCTQIRRNQAGWQKKRK